MDAARAAVHKITSRTGHKTDVDEVVNPAVTSETVKPHRHEELTEAVDREVHQHHYHTTVQPVAHREVIPEKHTHNLAPQIEKEFRHDNEQETQRAVSAELGRFANTSHTERTTTSQQAAPTVTGEHVHHHVHETVQPVIHKETVQPEVVHTTVPIHEVHHASATHHGMSALPMKTLDEFTKAGGLIGGSKSHTHEEYDGAPRPYNEKLATTIEKVLPGHHGSSTGTTHGSHAGGLTGSNTTGYDNTRSGGLTGSNTAGYDNTRSGGLTGSNTSDYDNTRSRDLSGRDTTLGTTQGYDRRPDSGVGGVGSNTKPSITDKLNPKVDADRDGKAGVMD